MNSIIKTLQYKYALSENGAKDMVRAFAACTFSDLVLMIPAGLLYQFIATVYTTEAPISSNQILFFGIGILVCLGLICLSTYIQYNCTFFATYKESGVRRLSLAEHIRKTATVIFQPAGSDGSDQCHYERLRNVGDSIFPLDPGTDRFCNRHHHYRPGAVFFNWKMAIASLWVLPVAFIILGSSANLQKTLGRKGMAARLACADGIQECLETLPQIKSNNYEDKYLASLKAKFAEAEKTDDFYRTWCLCLRFQRPDVFKAGHCNHCSHRRKAADPGTDKYHDLLPVSPCSFPHL